jgi:phage major head subunit gpT-like protein
MALAISEQWAELLEPGIRSVFYLTFSELAAPSRIPILFNQMGSTKASEHFLGVGGMSNWKEFEGTIEYDNPEQGYKTTLTHKEYAQGFPVERKLVDDDMYNVINARPRQLAMSAVRTREEHAASIFNNAFSSSYTGGDSIALCGAHPYSPSNASTQANNGTAALSYDNVVTARRTMREYKDDRGKLIAINPNLILVPPELEDTANRSVNTMRGDRTQRPDTADYSASLGQEHKMSYLVWDYLTDANNWFVIDTQLANIHLLWMDRTGLEFALDPTSGYDLVARYRGYQRYAYGWSDWRWCFGNAVA